MFDNHCVSPGRNSQSVMRAASRIEGALRGLEQPRKTRRVRSDVTRIDVICSLPIKRRYLLVVLSFHAARSLYQRDELKALPIKQPAIAQFEARNDEQCHE